MNALYHVVNDMQRYKKPLSGFHRLTKSIFNRQVDLRGSEQAMEQFLHHGAVQVVQGVSGNDFHISQEIRCVVHGSGNARLNLPTCDTDLVNQVPVLSDVRMI